MLKIKMLFAMALVSLLSVSGAYAVTPGPYIGAGVGYSSLDTPKNWLDFTPDAYTSKRGGLGGRIFAGYNFNEYLGLELGGTQYPQSSYKFSERALLIADAKGTYEMSAIDLIAKAYLPLSDTGFSLYALGGAAETFNTIKASGTSVFGETANDHANYRKLRPKYGVGVNYAVSNNLSANFEVSRIQGSGNFRTSSKPVTNADMAAITLSYSFG